MGPQHVRGQGKTLFEGAACLLMEGRRWQTLSAWIRVTATNTSANLLRLGLRRLLLLVCLSLAGALVSATLVRFAPGFGVDERELDPRWNASSVEALRQKQALHQGIPSFYFHYLSALPHAPLLESNSLNRPVTSLLRPTFP